MQRLSISTSAVILSACSLFAVDINDDFLKDIIARSICTGRRHVSCQDAEQRGKIEVVLTAAWGHDEGDVGIRHRSNSPSVAPSCIEVDESQNIYILDDVNKRVNKYGPEGHFLSAVSLEAPGGSFAVGKNDTIYVLEGSRLSLSVNVPVDGRIRSYSCESNGERYPAR